MVLKKIKGMLEAENNASQEEWLTQFGVYASYGFRHEGFLEREIKELERKKNRKADFILPYYRGEFYYIPPYAEQWVETLDEEDEDVRLELVEKIIKQSDNESYARGRIEGYEEYLNWCDSEDQENFEPSFIPVCLDCGAVILPMFDNCPCCGVDLYNIDDDDEEQEENDEEGFCDNCGAKLNTGSKFCSSCGEAVR